MPCAATATSFTRVLLRVAAAIVAAALPARSARAFHDATWQHDFWTLRDGLPQTSVSAILQGMDGALWLGTYGGLVRFDGERFRVIDSGGEPSLPTNHVASMALGPDGTVWCGGDAGEVFGVRDGDLVAMRRPGARHRVESIACAADGRVIVIAGTEVLACRPDVGDWSSLRTGRDAASWRKLIVAGDGSIWVASSDTVVRMAPEDGEPEMIRRNGPWSRPVLVDDRRRGVVHVLDDAGIATYGPGGAPRTDRPWVKPLRPFHGAMDQQGGLVLAGGGRVVAVSAAALDDPGGPVDTSLRAAGQTGILAVCVDRGGQTWVGHQYLGLHRIREQRALEPSLPDGLAGVECRSLLFDDDGRLMIGFADIGLVCEQPEGWLHKRELWIVRALERLGGGRYAASADSAFVVLDDRKEVVERIQPAIGRIYDLLLESDGAVLIGGEHGAARWRDGIVERMELPGADATPITALERAGDDLWIGGTGACWRVRGDDVVRFDASLGMPGGAARCFLVLDDGIVLVGSYGGGLVAIDGDRVRAYSAREGMPENIVSALVRDRERGRIWAVGNRGVYRFPEEDVAAYVRGELASPRFLAFREADGMGEGNPGRPGAQLLDDGDLLVATLAGARIVRSIAPPTVPSPVAVERVRVDGVEIPAPGVRLDLPATAQRVEIDIGCVNLVAPGSTHLEARLVGIDRAWVRLREGQDLAYERLPPGMHRLEVRAAIGDGPWTLAVPVLSIARPPAFGETWVASAFVAGAPVVVVVGVGLALRRRHRRRMREVQERLRLKAAAHARERRLREELDHRVRNNLSSVIGLLAIHRAGDFWTFGPRVPRLEQRVRAMAEVHGLLSRRAWSPVPLSTLVEGVAQRFAPDEGLELHGADPVVPARHCQALALVLHELASNALEHGAWRTAGGRVRVSVSLDAERRCRIAWREEGVTGATSPIVVGTGLGLVRGFVEGDLHGRIELALESHGLAAEIEFTMTGAAADTEVTRP